MADSVRQRRVREAIFRTLSNIIMHEYGATNLASVLISKVTVTPDLRVATVYYTLFGDTEREPVVEAFDRENKTIRYLLSKQISHLKHMPELRFRYDEHQEESIRLEKIFDQIKRDKDE